MFRPVWITPPGSSHRLIHTHQWKEILARLLPPLTLWICVSVSLRYGYYGDCRMVVGPSSSRLIQASSVFVHHVEVRDEDNKGVLLYGFTEKPELKGETNWSASNFLIVGSYSSKGISLWLNKGSRIKMRLETQSSSLNEIQVIMIKGERELETLLPRTTSPSDTLASTGPIHGERELETLLPRTTSPSDTLASTGPIHGREVEYNVVEDNKYFLRIINNNRRNIILSMKLNVTSKTYDLTKAKNMCSTLNGSCRLKLVFPNTHYVLITTPDNGDLQPWSIELSFVARVITYIAILGFMIIVIFLVLKYLGAFDSEIDPMDVISRGVTETEPILPQKPVRFTYGTNTENDDSGASASSSEDLYDAKLCVICYDEHRNCFYVPCGHCATCYDCAQRIMEGEGKMCPICRRPIHKVRRLFTG